MNCRKKPGSVLVLVGGVILIVTLVILIAFPSMFNKELEKQTTLVNDTVIFNLWKDLPIPIYQKFYFFNITNKESFLDSSADRLSVVEVGPYTYSSKWVKENITHEDDTVSYQEVKTYQFEPDLSVGAEDDEIWTLNGPYATAGHVVGTKPGYMQDLMNLEFISLNQELIIKKKIGELAFKGYKDKLLSNPAIKKYFKSPYKDGYFAWFYHKNATDDGLFTVYTGEGNHANVNIIKSWNGQSSLKFWANDSCNSINGTNAELGPPLFENQKRYSFFQPLACRSLTFDYTGEHVHKGVTSKRFQNTYKIFATEKINPENYCFIKDKKQRSGVLDIGSCQYDAPVYLSFPHFYLADATYFLAVDGVIPDEDIHKSYIDVEPVTGVSISLAIRVQVNLKLDRNKRLHQFENITSGIYPVFWTEIRAEIDDDLSHMFNDQLHKPKSVAYAVLGTLCLFSGSLLLYGLVLMRKYRNRMYREIQPLVNNTGNVSYDSNKNRDEPLGRSPKSQYKKVTEARSNIVNPCAVYNEEAGSQTTKGKATETYTRQSDSVYEGTLKAGIASKNTRAP
ncbi:Scavenger receptor class B member 1 like protein [Argiope bruennichi]|uniref:Scavenger receptor class B member 1 n=1 Tax=Argiope bruennichi TaxID=94029 RepID=A0A8T0E3X1_ARGBR|nr:Scavenger receptor class B member 1 like protein [Argiope bruennichi]